MTRARRSTRVTASASRPRRAADRKRAVDRRSQSLRVEDESRRRGVFARRARASRPSGSRTSARSRVRNARITACAASRRALCAIRASAARPARASASRRGRTACRRRSRCRARGRTGARALRSRVRRDGRALDCRRSSRARAPRASRRSSTSKLLTPSERILPSRRALERAHRLASGHAAAPVQAGSSRDSRRPRRFSDASQARIVPSYDAFDGSTLETMNSCSRGRPAIASPTSYFRAAVAVHLGGVDVDHAELDAAAQRAFRFVACGAAQRHVPRSLPDARDVGIGSAKGLVSIRFRRYRTSGCARHTRASRRANDGGGGNRPRACAGCPRELTPTRQATTYVFGCRVRAIALRAGWPGSTRCPRSCPIPLRAARGRRATPCPARASRRAVRPPLGARSLGRRRSASIDSSYCCLGTDGWRDAIHTSVTSNHDHLYPPDPNAPEPEDVSEDDPELEPDAVDLGTELQSPSQPTTASPQPSSTTRPSAADTEAALRAARSIFPDHANATLPQSPAPTPPACHPERSEGPCLDPSPSTIDETQLRTAAAPPPTQTSPPNNAPPTTPLPAQPRRRPGEPIREDYTVHFDHTHRLTIDGKPW